MKPEQSNPVAISFRFIEPSWRNYIHYVDLASRAGDENMAKFAKTYQALPPRDRSTMMPEQICDLAGVEPGDLIAAVSKQVWVTKSTESVICASMKHPKVVEATADYGINNQLGEKDRELFFRLTGGLPDKKGASIVINNSPQTANFTNQSPTAGANGFRPMDQRVIEMGKLLDPPDDPSIMTVPLSSDGEDSADVLEEDDSEED